MSKTNHNEVVSKITPAAREVLSRNPKQLVHLHVYIGASHPEYFSYECERILGGDGFRNSISGSGIPSTSHEGYPTASFVYDYELGIYATFQGAEKLAALPYVELIALTQLLSLKYGAARHLLKRGPDGEYPHAIETFPFREGSSHYGQTALVARQKVLG
jgi:hypothetical protein